EGSPAMGDVAFSIDQGQGPGPLFGVPELPASLVECDELTELVATLRDPGADVRAVGLHGAGGVGKSVLACALAREPAVRRMFSDGIHWVTVGQTADLMAVQCSLLERVGARADDVRSATEGAARLRVALAEQQCLLVIDDVWSAAAAAAF